jgi:Uma2 family endonuclease
MATATKQESPPEQRIILKNVSWETYEGLLADHLDSSVPHFTYDQGVLEIVSPSPTHERAGYALALIVEMVALELGIEVLGVGSMTFKRKELQRGFEPDGSFYIQSKPLVADKREIDADTDPPPDLIIEVDVTSPSLQKLPIFARMGVPEIWRYHEATEDVVILGLVDDDYRKVPMSNALPALTGDVLTQFLAGSRNRGHIEWMRMIQAWARSHQQAYDR